MKIPENYRAFWAHAPARPVLLWSIVGRLPLYLTSLAIALQSLRDGDGLVRTGLLLAGFSIGSAIAGPLVARGMDRFGQTGPLIGTAAVHVLALAALVLLPVGEVGAVVAVVVAGASIPPTSASLRALWGTLPLGERGRRGAFALEAVLGEVFVICGPIALSVSLFFFEPSVALLIGAVMTAAGAVGVASSAASRAWRAEPTGQRHLLGPLAHPAFVLLFVVLLLAAAGGGTFSLLLPAFAEDIGTTSAAGFLFGVWGVGSALGGIWFGSREPSAQNVQKLFVVGLAAVGVGLALPVVAWDFWSMLVAVAIGGVAIAPVSIVEYEMIQRLAPRAHITEAFTWVQTANVAGSAVGAQVAGIVSAGAGLTWGFAVAPILLVAAIATALASSRSWRGALNTPAQSAQPRERELR